MKKIVYEWKMPGLYPEVKADIVISELKEIQINKGSLRNEFILDYAKDKKSELNKCFTWDNTEAAEKYRLHEAGQINKNILIVLIDNEKEQIKTRAIESVMVDYVTDDGKEKRQREYIFVTQALDDQIMSEKIVEEICDLLEEAKNKLKEFNKFITIMRKK